MEKLFYSFKKSDAKVECFKMLDVDELTDNAYKIMVTNTKTKETDFVTTNTPQAAIALADLIKQDL